MRPVCRPSFCAVFWCGRCGGSIPMPRRAARSLAGCCATLEQGGTGDARRGQGGGRRGLALRAGAAAPAALRRQAERRTSARQREAKQAVADRHHRFGGTADRAQDFRMGGVEAAGQRAERRQDQLARRSATKQRRETSRPRWLILSLGWKWPESSGRRSSGSAWWRSTSPSTSASSTISPPQGSAKPGS